MARSDQGGVSFMRRMEAARSQARATRNTGRHVGASAKGWAWKRPDTDPADWFAIARRAADGWRIAATEARSEFAAACLNLKHREAFDDCPF